MPDNPTLAGAAPRDEAAVRQAYESLSALEAWTRPFSPDGEREKILTRLAAAPRADPTDREIWLAAKSCVVVWQDTEDVAQAAKGLRELFAAARAPGGAE